MTVATLPNVAVGTGDGANTTWSYSFYVADEDDITVETQVIATGVRTTITAGLYTVSGVGTSSGSVEYPLSGSPVAATSKVIVTRTVDLLQSTDVANQGGFLPEVYETALDKVTMAAQQMTEALDRTMTVKLEDASTVTDYDLPTPVAGYALKWNAGGTGLTTGEGVAGPAGDAVFYDTQAIAAAATIPSGIDFIMTAGYAAIGDGGGAMYSREVSEPSHAGKFQNSVDSVWWQFYGDEINVKSIGAVGDSTACSTGTGTDDRTAFVNAIDIAETLQIPIRVPSLAAGKAFRISARIDIETAVSFVGDGANVQTVTDADPSLPNGGSWIYFDHTDEGFRFRSNPSGNPKTVTCIDGIGFCRNQPAATGGWTPTANNYDLRIETRVDLKDIFILNATKGIQVRSSGQLQIHGLRMQAFDEGIYVERSSGNQRWEKMHLWYWYSQDSDITAYTIANTSAVKVARADSIFITNSFALGVDVFFEYDDSAAVDSGMAGLYMSNVYSDQCGGFLRWTSDNFQGYGSISNVLVNSDSGLAGSGAAFRITGTVASYLDVNNLRVTRAGEEIFYVDGTGAHVINVSSQLLENWSAESGTHNAFRAEGSSTINLLNIPEFGSASNQYSTAGSGVINTSSRVDQSTLVASTIPRFLNTDDGELGVTGVFIDNNDSLIGYSLFMFDQAADQASTAGRSQLWSKNTSPSTPWYTDDDDTQFELARFAAAKTDHAVPRADGTDGKLQDSGVIIDDSDNVTLNSIELVAGGPTVSAGSGTPESAVTADVGSLFLRTDGGASTSVYVKESGTGNTGWVAK